VSTGPPVSLRRAAPADLPFLIALVTHPDVDPFLAAGRDRSGEAMAADVERSGREPDSFGVFVVELDGRPVGTMRFTLVNRRSSIADLTQLALHPDARGRGVADKAARLLQRHLVRDLGIHRLQLEIYAFNERALAHAERVGFRREGVRRLAYRSGDGWVDGVLFGLVAEDLIDLV
jgi:aminoglycoside 6'-N-acetyltransferase